MIVVKDLDTGLNVKVSCTVDNKKFILQLKPSSIIPSLQTSYFLKINSRIDREESAQEFVTIKCMDEGTPPQTSSTTITFKILDLNDNAPYISDESSLFGLVNENSPSGSRVTTILAKDKDSEMNGRITFAIQNESLAQIFEIKVTGELITLLPLDREKQDKYLVPIIISDGGNPHRSITVTVTVTV